MPPFDPYDLTLLLVGLAILGAAWLPLLVHRRPLSLPILYVGFGFLIFQLPLGGLHFDPFTRGELVERVTELSVIVALTSAGLKLDRPPGLRRWGTTWRLLAVTMPLCVAALFALGWGVLGWGAAGALLMAAVLAPTDPVLAADVQAAPPGKGENDVQFALTSEAGLNDGLAFPFTNAALAVALAGAGAASGAWVGPWLLTDVLYKVGVGLVAGVAVGYGLARLVFSPTAQTHLGRTSIGLLALTITLLTYGIAEVLHAYGFLAVFAAALAVRHYERNHTYHEVLHTFSEQIERLLMVLILIVFGGVLASGVLAPLSWPMVAVGLVFLFVVRPLAGWVGLLGTPLSRRERAAVSFFGIRGIGSLYYLAYALNEVDFLESQRLWALVSFVVLVSIVLHGVLASPFMRRVER